MDAKHAKNKAKSTWKQENIDMKFLKDEVKQKMTAKEATRKVKAQPIVSSGKMLEYEQETRAYKKKAKELRRKRNQRQGNNIQSDDDNDDDKREEQMKETYSGNFRPVTMSKATRKKKKRLAKKRKAERKQRKQNKSTKYSDSESSNDSISSDDESDSSSEDTAPKVRYGKDMKSNGGRMKFNGIKSMKNTTKKRNSYSTQSPKSPPLKSSKPKKTKSSKISSQNKSDDDDTKIMDDDTKYFREEKETKMKFIKSKHVYNQLLSKPDGVLCGGETIMYFVDEDGSEYFYLATDDDEDVIGVLQYNVSEDKWTKFADYPNNFSPDLHGNCIDIKRQKLYIFDRTQFGILDLKTKKWDIQSSNFGRNGSESPSETIMSVVTPEYDPTRNDSDSLYKLNYKGMANTNLQLLGVQSLYLPSPIDEIHIFGRQKIPPGTFHCRLDSKKKYKELNGFDREELMRGHKMVYSEGTQKLIVCGGQKQDEFGNWIDSNSIWIVDIERKAQSKYNWRELKKCKLPYGGKTFGVVTAYECILVVIYLRNEENKEIYCLDLRQNERNYKFIKSKQVFPFDDDCEYTDVIKTRQDMVHCLYFSLFGHSKLSMNKIVPNELKTKYAKRYKMCVHGFVRCELKNETLKYYVPQTVIGGIAKYLSELC